MDFRTELPAIPSSWKIDLTDPVLTIGSCFAQSIGEKFRDHKFTSLINPLGTTYHPLSIHKLVSYAIYQEYPARNTYMELNGIHYNYDFHSNLRSVNLSEIQKEIQERIATLHFYLKSCKVLILTYGTSWLYERVDTREYVANCHKMPASYFMKRISSMAEMRESFDTTLKDLQALNPSIRIILTVSPVRHTKDTLPLNNVSKSLLRILCHHAAEENLNVNYFPAYEIMMDDLRDYRFYKDDMIHPTVTAENYIWEKFILTFFDQSTAHFIRQWSEIRKALSHRPFNADSAAHKSFLLDTLLKLENLKGQADVEKEIDQIKTTLLSQENR